MHVVKNQELLNTADRSLANVTPEPKCDSSNAYLTKEHLPRVKNVENPTKFLHAFEKQGSHNK